MILVNAAMPSCSASIHDTISSIVIDSVHMGIIGILLRGVPLPLFSLSHSESMLSLGPFFEPAPCDPRGLWTGLGLRVCYRGRHKATGGGAEPWCCRRYLNLDKMYEYGPESPHPRYSLVTITIVLGHLADMRIACMRIHAASI